MTGLEWLPLGAAFGTTMLLMPAFVLAFRRGQQLDLPNHRTLHEIPTPRGAGLALAIGAFVGFVLVGNVPLAFWFAVAGFTILGALDDRFFLHPFTKLALQIFLTVPIALSFDVGLDVPPLAIMAVPVLLLASVNAVNFMDGINGITAMHAIVWGIVYAIALNIVNENAFVTLALILAAVGLAFLPWNIPKAHIFLGDSGSFLIGAYAGMLALLGIFAGQPIAFLAPLAIYGMDTGFTLARRIMRGNSVSQAHREHVFQRLVLAGWGHVPTAAVTASFTVSASVLGLLSIYASPVQIIMLVTGIVLLGVTYVTLPISVRGLNPRSGGSH